MNWKQPIPTGLEQIFGEDYRAMQLYKELIYRACNQNTTAIINKKIIPVRRGQTIYGRMKFAQYLCWDDKTCDRALERVHQTYNLVTMQRGRNFTVVTINNYDDLINMTMQRVKKRPSKGTSDDLREGLQMTTSKSVKSDKSERDIEVYVAAFNKLFNSKYEVTDGRANRLGLRLRKYSLVQLLQALENLSRSKFHQGDNERGWKADPDFLLRSDEQVDRWINTGSGKQPQQVVASLSAGDISHAAAEALRKGV